MQLHNQFGVVLEINRNNLFFFEPQILSKSSDGSEPSLDVMSPSAIGLDFEFSDVSMMYGLPERSTSLSLPMTATKDGKFDEPLRLYAMDVFEYEANSIFPLYGFIPMLGSLSKKGRASGVLWLNGADTYVHLAKNDDLSADKSSTGQSFATPQSPSSTPDSSEPIFSSSEFVRAHFMSKCGRMDFLVLPGPSPKDVTSEYCCACGLPAMPPLFSLGYHQCRWNYYTEGEVLEVANKMDEAQMPVDVIWLDIEHTNGKRYFTWDTPHFPNPTRMMMELASGPRSKSTWPKMENSPRASGDYLPFGSGGRRLVTIVDPHVKVEWGYHVYQQAQQKGFLLRRTYGSLSPNENISKLPAYEGHCWPGTSSYPDFLNESVRVWWAELHKVGNYPHATPFLHHWNDMNEPTVFDVEEGVVPGNVVHLNGRTHAELHNVYGHHHVMASALGHFARYPGERPFILTRSFFAGTHRYAAMWTGDNDATWEHLQSSVPMLLSLSVCGYSFVGADVGGFFRNPTPELFDRWYQNAIFQPFFRSHAHHESPRREPYLQQEPHKSIIRSALYERYALIPYIYSLAFDAAVSGIPMMRPLWMEFSNDNTAVNLCQTGPFANEYMFGSALLVCPVLKPSVSSISAYLPGSQDNFLEPFVESNTSSSQAAKGNTCPEPALCWYEYRTGECYKPGVTNVPVSKEAIPVFQKSGTILPLCMERVPSTYDMLTKPLMFSVALDEADSAAHGTLFVDDGHSHAWEVVDREALFETRFFQVNISTDKLDEETSDLDAKDEEDSIKLPPEAVQRIRRVLKEYFIQQDGKREAEKEKPSRVFVFDLQLRNTEWVAARRAAHASDDQLEMRKALEKSVQSYLEEDSLSDFSPPSRTHGASSQLLPLQTPLADPFDFPAIDYQPSSPSDRVPLPPPSWKAIRRLSRVLSLRFWRSNSSGQILPRAALFLGKNDSWTELFPTLKTNIRSEKWGLKKKENPVGFEVDLPLYTKTFDAWKVVFLFD